MSDIAEKILAFVTKRGNVGFAKLDREIEGSPAAWCCSQPKAQDTRTSSHMGKHDREGFRRYRGPAHNKAVLGSRRPRRPRSTTGILSRARAYFASLPTMGEKREKE
jgi:hypothetical protein